MRDRRLTRDRKQPEPPAVEGARWISLGDGKFSLVDERDFPILNKHRWLVLRGYAATFVTVGQGKRAALKMHRVIMRAPDDMEVDHINGDRLDNRTANLRIVTHAINMANRHGTARRGDGFLGVYFKRDIGKWGARVMVGGRSFYCGWHLTAEDAARARDAMAREKVGEGACYNFPLDGERAARIAI